MNRISKRLKSMYKKANNIDEKIRDFNDSVGENEQIFFMYELEDELINYGYEPYEFENDLYDLSIIDERYFDSNDDYFWWSDNGYLFSGNDEEVLAIINSYEDTSENTDSGNFYRYTVSIDGEDLGFVTAFDKLIDKGVVEENGKIIQRVNSLFSRMKVPEFVKLDDSKRSWFTEKGKEKFSSIISSLIKILNELGYATKEQSCSIDNVSDKVVAVDDYQVLI